MIIVLNISHHAQKEETDPYQEGQEAPHRDRQEGFDYEIVDQA